MKNTFKFLLVGVFISFGLISCTSHDAKEDSDVVSDYETSEPVVNSSDSKPAEEAKDSTEVSSTESNSAPADQAAATTEIPASDLDVKSEQGAPPAQEVSAPVENKISDSIASTEPTATVTEAETPPPAELPEIPAPETSTVTAPSASEVTKEEEKPASTVVTASLQKVATTPWKVGKNWANAVYIARPGDTLKSVSQKIYGNDSKVSELKKINPTFKSRDLKPSDKVYYTSALRPQDSEKVLNFYEEQGIQPQVYAAKSGDNIRKISKNLLGYDNAWKEVWSTNSVESKATIEEGTQLKYWADMPSTSTPTASAEVNKPSADSTKMLEDAKNNLMDNNAENKQATESVPPVADNSNMNAPSADSSANIQAAGTTQAPPPEIVPPQNELPPPPPPAEVAQALPPPPAPSVQEEMPVTNKMSRDSAATNPSQEDTTMTLAAVGIAAAGLASLMVIRKKRKQKDLMSTMSETQVG